MRARDFYIGFVESIRMRASDPKNEFCGLFYLLKSYTNFPVGPGCR